MKKLKPGSDHHSRRRTPAASDFNCIRSHAAPGDVDLSFDPGSGVNGPVQTILVQPDGKMIIAGQFTMVKGLVRTNLARLNADGSGDATFDFVSEYKTIQAVALQADGKLLVSGQFTLFLR